MKNNYVCLAEDKHYYSVPYHFIGKKVTLLYSNFTVEIFHRYERIAVHKRNRHMFGHTWEPSHLASQHRFLSDWNPEKFLERAEAIGLETRLYVITCGIDWNRTSDTRIFSPLLYHLSYDAISSKGGAKVQRFLKNQIPLSRIRDEAGEKTSEDLNQVSCSGPLPSNKAGTIQEKE